MQLSLIASSNQSHTDQAPQQRLGAQIAHVEEKQCIANPDDESEQTGSSDNAFLESLALRSPLANVIR